MCMTDPGLVTLHSYVACLTTHPLPPPPTSTPDTHLHPTQLRCESNLRSGLGQGGAAVRRGPEAHGPLQRPPVPALRPPLWEMGGTGGVHRLLPLHPRSAFQGKYLLSLDWWSVISVVALLNDLIFPFSVSAVPKAENLLRS